MLVDQFLAVHGYSLLENFQSGKSLRIQKQGLIIMPQAITGIIFLIRHSSIRERAKISV
jgi:hypothetical protein